MGWRNWFSCCQGDKQVEDLRKVIINGEQEHGLTLHDHYDTNQTSTTKYNIFTFFPKALFEQYRRVANIYFTIVAGLSLAPFSPVRPWSTFLPLIIVLGVSMVKEAVEDYKRYKQDKEINNRKVEVFNLERKEFEFKTWSEVKVGNIVKVSKDEQIPADLFFLGSETEEGTCYIETMNLDGETNLKIKKCLDQTKEVKTATLHELKGVINCELPNSRLYQFTGNLDLDPPLVPQKQTLPLSPACILLRGCSLRNTKLVYGVVVFAGHDTKIFMNATEPPSKRTQLERTVDKIILLMFALLFSWCIIGAVYFGYWTVNQMPNAFYLDPSDTETQFNPDQGATVGILSFFTSFILYGYLIPISLYVSLEIVKIFQSMVFIACDRHMYHAETDTPALARTSNLNEELGQINTILSDKTGTLTRNVMEFFKCSIDGISYGAGITEIEKSNALRKGQTLSMTADGAADQYRERFFNFYDKRIMGLAWTKVPDPYKIEMFFRLLAVCHTVIPDGPDKEADIKYEAESPDESALVVAAKVFGFFFFKRTSTTVVVREKTKDGTKDVEYEVLNVLDFTSTRKRMSVIVRDQNKKLWLFCKGADNVIFDRLDPKTKSNLSLKEKTSRHLEEYGSAGLRTLCLSYTPIDAASYEKWQVKFQAAKTALQDRDEKLAAVNEEIEKNLILLGCTAIEDKLQEGVPQAIAQLAEAGIRLWVLTGDKMETAVNIAFACSLIREDMVQIHVTAASPQLDKLEADGKDEEAKTLALDMVKEQLKQALGKVEEQRKSERAELAMVIDGKALAFALHPDVQQQFLQVATQCKAVVCCRVSPLQKALVTELVKDSGDLTLAIGDGANDVGMIQKADIGVGISGQEGMQAVQNSDFAIAQFRFLVPLLLVHGRWSYKRIARMVNYFFYKNLLFGTTIFVYNAFAVFSGQPVYNDSYMSFFNVVFTALPPVIIGICDRDVDRESSLKYPGLYLQGQKNLYFSVWAIAGWLFSAILQCTILMVLVMVGTAPTVAAMGNGNPWPMWAVGMLMFTNVIFVVNWQLAFVIEQWTWLHHLAIWGSQVVWFLYILVYGAFPISLSTEVYYLFIGIVAPTPQYWLYVILVPCACLVPDFLYRSMRRYLDPADHQIIQEIEANETKENAGGSTYNFANPGNQRAKSSQMPLLQRGKSKSAVPNMATSPKASKISNPQEMEEGNQFATNNRPSSSKTPPATPPRTSQPRESPPNGTVKWHVNSLAEPTRYSMGQPKALELYTSALR